MDGKSIECPDGYKLEFEWSECWCCNNCVDMSLDALPTEMIESIGYHLDPVTLTCFSLADPAIWQILMSSLFIERMRKQWDGQSIECPDGFKLEFEWSECWCCPNYIDVRTKTGCYPEVGW